MEPIPASTNKREIYSIITVGIIGLIGVGRRLWIHRSGTPSTSIVEETLQIVSTNTVLENTSGLPLICKETLSLLDCVINTLPHNEDHQALSLYYQQMISKRNILKSEELIRACNSQRTYITTLKEPYMTIVNNCIHQ